MPVVFINGLRLARLCIGRLGRIGIGAVDGLVDVLRSAVIGGNHQVPVAEDLVKVTQIACCGIRRLHGITTLINEGVDLQTVLFTRAQHKLPESCGTSP